jgi:hypothetical protein
VSEAPVAEPHVWRSAAVVDSSAVFLSFAVGSSIGVVGSAGVVGAAGIVGYLAAGGPRFVLEVVRLADLLQNRVTGPAAQMFALSFGIEALAVGVLSLVPLPPLTGWRILMLFSGRSIGWQRAKEYLEERNFGVVALLVLLLVPLGVGGPILLELVDWAIGLLLGVAA